MKRVQMMASREIRRERRCDSLIHISPIYLGNASCQPGCVICVNHGTAHLRRSSQCAYPNLDSGSCCAQRRDSDEATTAKKQRVVWSVEMHQQFVAAVNQLGIDSRLLGTYP